MDNHSKLEVDDAVADHRDSIHTVSESLSTTYALLEEQVSSLKQQLSVLSRQRLEELTQKEKLATRFAALFDVLPGGVVVLDTQGHVIECNRVAEQLIDNSLMGQPWRNVLDEFFVSASGNANGILLKNGSVVTVATTSLSDGNGQIVLLTDQTEGRQLRHRLLRDKNRIGHSMADPDYITCVNPICVSKAAHDLFNLAEKVAVTDCSVLISGESGTGKEVLARFIHEHSHRRLQPFVAINCAAIPETMLESILFGHEKGAFTGANQSSVGKFELANGGTLLLDEISEMTPALQAKLLRVLQEREVERVGGKKNIALDIRILATTNRNLARAIQEGSFREDLYYRLSVFPLNLPALRERRDDIPLLARQFIWKYSTPAIKNITATGVDTADNLPLLDAAAVKKLLNHEWPGNVRELENVIQRALVLQNANTIRSDDIVLSDLVFNANADQSFRISNVNCLADDKLPLSSDNAKSNAQAFCLTDEMQRLEYERIYAVLCCEQGSRRDAAEKLGISERTLRYRVSEMRDAGYLIP